MKEWRKEKEKEKEKERKRKKEEKKRERTGLLKRERDISDPNEKLTASEEKRDKARRRGTNEKDR